jgi:hypothetical protein
MQLIYIYRYVDQHRVKYESESRLLLKCPEKQRWREELLNNKWPHINEGIALRKKLAVKNATEKRNLCTLACKIKCKWENQMKKREMWLGEREITSLYIGSIGYK